MEQKNDYFTYNGDTVIILPGILFTKIELITRLKEMDFLSIDSSYNKNILVVIYEAALNNDKNKVTIFNKLKMDTLCYYSKNNFPRRELIYENPNTILNYNNTKKYTAYGVINQNNINDEKDKDSSMSSMPTSDSSSFCMNVLKFINNHKMDIMKKVAYILIIYGFDAFLKSFAQKHLVLGKVVNYFRGVATPRRLVLGFLVFYIVNYILNIFFYYLFGFGILTVMFFIFKNKIKEFIFNI